MIGIKAYGAYLPKNLLSRDLIGKAWDFPIIPGSKAVASIDEDTITMAVEAGLDCLTGIDPKTIDGLFFATTTQVYTEKDSASLIATVLDLREDIITIDFTDSLKAGTTAITRAIDTIKANVDVKSILVIAADMRTPEPSTMWEYGFADGAAAVLIVEEEILPISVDDYYSISANITGPWKRTEKDKFIRTFEPKTDAQFYVNSIKKVIIEILNRNNLNPEDIGHAAFYYNNPRLHARVAKSLKFPQGVAQNGLFFQIGDLGTPMPLMLLISALKRPKPNAKVILAGYGDGADAILMQVKDKKMVRELSKSHVALGYQKNMEILDNYNVFINNKKLLEKDRYTRKSSAVIVWRETDSIYQMYGNKCKICGLVQYPRMLTSCYECRTTNKFEKIKLKLKGTVFTYTLDHLIGGNYYDTPVPRCVIDLDGGGRILLDMTEIKNPEKDVKIGMRVELTFRRIHEGAEFINYYWKCRPERGRN
ncbi:MAG: OB-fold domain-containing protein [Promethearchaeota archaeon]